MTLTVLLTLATLQAKAAVIDFPDFNGVNVIFTDIAETNSSLDPTFSLFAGVTADLDTLEFGTLNFIATSSTGANPAFQDGKVRFAASAKPGKLINSITIRGGGAYVLDDPNALASVFLGGPIFSSGGDNLVFSETDVFSGVVGGTTSEPWSLTATFGSFTPSETFFFDLDGRLNAFSSTTNSNASIAMQFFDVSVGTVSAVPEPSAFAFVSLCTSLFSMRRRQQR